MRMNWERESRSLNRNRCLDVINELFIARRNCTRIKCYRWWKKITKKEMKMKLLKLTRINIAVRWCPSRYSRGWHPGIEIKFDNYHHPSFRWEHPLILSLPYCAFTVIRKLKIFGHGSEGLSHQGVIGLNAEEERGSATPYTHLLAINPHYAMSSN